MHSHYHCSWNSHSVLVNHYISWICPSFSPVFWLKSPCISRLRRFSGPGAGRQATRAGRRPGARGACGLQGGGPVEGPGPGEAVVHVLRQHGTQPDMVFKGRKWGKPWGYVLKIVVDIVLTLINKNNELIILDYEVCLMGCWQWCKGQGTQTVMLCDVFGQKMRKTPVFFRFFLVGFWEKH